jgi:hypothetical protein
MTTKSLATHLPDSVEAVPMKADTPRSALMILDAVTQRGADVATIEAIAKLYREERDDGRRMAFDAAMAQAQSEMVRIPRDATNSQTRSTYSTYAMMDRKLRPIYTKHGFGLSFNTTPHAAADYVRVTCHVSHVGGWSHDYQIDMPADGKGAKGGDVMTKTHAVGSATQYGMRYLLKMIFNVALGEDADDDGNAAGGSTASKEKVNELRELIKQTGRSEEKACEYFRVQKLEDVSAKDAEGMIVQLRKASRAPDMVDGIDVGGRAG